MTITTDKSKGLYLIEKMKNIKMNMKNLKICDKCKTNIINGKCNCGFWYEKGEAPPFLEIMEKAMMAYDFICEQHNDDSPLTGDHHSGNCIAIFKGDYERSMKVKQYIIVLMKEEKK